MTPRSSGPTRVPDLILERYRLGEMTPDETAAFERRVHGDDELRQRLQALEVKDKKKEEKYNPSKGKLMEELREGLDYLYEERIKENMK